VQTILINIFGGIMKCDTIAEGIIKAAEMVNLRVPLVCRLTGTNADRANEMLEKYSQKLKITTATDLDDAAQKSAKLVSAIAK
jgi:succinyl-CoA synthetase beta subunit